MSARAIVLAILLGGALVAEASAQPAVRPHRMVAMDLDSGSLNGSGDEFRVIPLGEVAVAGLSWLRLAFGDTDLGKGSYILLQSVANGDTQRFNASSLKEWNNASGAFVGDRVTATLHLSPVDRGVRVRVRAAQASAGGPPPAIVETICGTTDNRVPSSDNRVGRLFGGGCTAFRIANGSLMTAGHCADFDPDQGGSKLPDGNLDLNGFVEFNVPFSTELGVTNPAPLDDQYPIDLGSVMWRYDGAGSGLGKDWCVFRVGRNANTQLLPHQAYGLPFRVTREFPVLFETVRVTGFGIDFGTTANLTNQTAAGAFHGQDVDGSDIALHYRVDTMPANSGSPVIWPAHNVVFGVHTTGGCDDGVGTNGGTSFEVDALEAAMNNSPGTSTRYVDNGHPIPTAPDGTLSRPWPSIAVGASAVPSGRILSIFAGTYDVQAGTTITRAMTLAAPAGAVVIQ